MFYESEFFFIPLSITFLNPKILFFFCHRGEVAVLHHPSCAADEVPLCLASGRWFEPARQSTN